MYYIGYDVGSSSIKAALVEASTGKSVGVVQEPEQELHIKAVQNGWAEQDPLEWWACICRATKKLLTETGVSSKQIKGVGIAYQMHGLVLVDAESNPLRDAIIWCDSRAVEIGSRAFEELGQDRCATHLLNSPANFTASKLKWVRDNEPELYNKAFKFLLPGDYIASKLTGVLNTTPSGLSEGILWDFKANEPATWLLEHYGISTKLIPDITDTFSQQGTVSAQGALASGLPEGIPLLYRAGDQPNNALSLNVFEPGEIAATGGTSGVVYAVTDSLSVKECTRVNNFVHVNHSQDATRIGKLLNINGAGIQYRWLKENLKISSYKEMNVLASSVPVGAEGLSIIPFGNGAERILNNRALGTQICDLNLNMHNNAHLCRATLEGIAFSFVYGIEILKQDGIEVTVIKTGNDNLFRSELFSETIATLIGHPIEIFDTTGAIGAARAAGLSDGSFKDLNDIASANDHVRTFDPRNDAVAYTAAYSKWKRTLENILKHN